MLKPKLLLKRSAVGVGEFSGRSSALSEIQCTLTGTGALAATIKIWGSNDQIGKIDLGDIVLSGSDLVTDSDSIERAYSAIQAEVVAISGTNAEVTVTFSDDIDGGV